ncbi:hypothetical protein Dvul_1306 [Nitratidesulfovibrio vulgaris DP4]|uniref:Uncharacterized protein n=1 Tax=Nitratidesulfovibrio vulgaris (strain DP4) TaxID=391774 RepID=A0A0H3A9Y3_NITV4|nr:hypothetical protein Dvul_1306 [Nitratidesulfovibrio vulgaris DP4]
MPPSRSRRITLDSSVTTQDQGESHAQRTDDRLRLNAPSRGACCLPHIAHAVRQAHSAWALCQAHNDRRSAFLTREVAKAACDKLTRRNRQENHTADENRTGREFIPACSRLWLCDATRRCRAAWSR